MIPNAKIVEYIKSFHDEDGHYSLFDKKGEKIFDSSSENIPLKFKATKEQIELFKTAASGDNKNIELIGKYLSNILIYILDNGPLKNLEFENLGKDYIEIPINIKHKCTIYNKKI